MQHFDHRSGADRSVAHTKISNPLLPQGRPKSLDTARASLQVREQELVSSSSACAIGYGQQ